MSGIFGDDHEFLRHMASFETNDGAMMELGTGGMWRVSMKVLDTINRYRNRTSPSKAPLQTDILIRLERDLCFSWCNTMLNKAALDTPLYSALSVMLHLRLQNDAQIPDNTTSQAILWQRNFNESGDIVSFATHGIGLYY